MPNYGLDKIRLALDLAIKADRGIGWVDSCKIAKKVLEEWQEGELLEERVAEWVITRIGTKHVHPRERAMRLLEEAIELAQAEGITYDMAIRQTDHVYNRPPGDPEQEAAGVAVGLYGYCYSRGLKLREIATREIERIEAKPLSEIRGSLARKTDADLVNGPAPEDLIPHVEGMTEDLPCICFICVAKRRGVPTDELSARTPMPNLEPEKSRSVNQLLVGIKGEEITFLAPLPQVMSREQALNLAAWIVAIADPGERDFRATLAEVQRS